MNSERKTSQQTLVSEKEALSVYFEALLREPPVEEEATPAVEAAVESPPETGTRTTPAPAPAPVEASTPAWGENDFQAMLFKVAGLTLAVPLVELSGVQEWDADAITPMPGHAPWYLGLTDYRGHSVPVVDTAWLVMPEDRRARLGDPLARIRRIVFIDDGRWGLACDEVAEVVKLAPDAVRWRTLRTRRQWLAGTVIDHMCAIIDPPAFARMLATGIEDAPEESGSESA